MIYMRAEGCVPNLARVVQSLNKGSGIINWFNITNVQCVGHGLNNARVIVFVIYNLREHRALH